MRKVLFAVLLFSALMQTGVYAYEETITVAAEKSEGVALDLAAGTYRAEVAGGAVALFFPIHPHYGWLYSLAIGTGCEGGQDEPNIGTIYMEPEPRVSSQADAEAIILQAFNEGQVGTSLEFTLPEAQEVRFWVSDFDYSDNTGSERVKIYSLE
jgi:hypothetical protein